MKYYTMKECFDACGDDDVPFVRDGFNSGNMETKKALMNYDVIAFKPLELDSDVWQIKRAGPKVITANIYVAESFDGFSDHRETKKKIESFEAGDKNGQLREWLRPEQVELREACESIPKEIMSIRISRALENLKPPQ